MREQTTVLYEATNLDTPAAIAGALVQIQILGRNRPFLTTSSNLRLVVFA
jgi:hypothetical protein